MELKPIRYFKKFPKGDLKLKNKDLKREALETRNEKCKGVPQKKFKQIKEADRSQPKLSRTAVKDIGSGKQNHFFLPDLSRFSLLQGGRSTLSFRLMVLMHVFISFL